MPIIAKIPTLIIDVFILQKLSPMEVFGMRNIGAMFFGWSFTAWYATSFRYDEDRSAFFLSEILVSM